MQSGQRIAIVGDSGSGKTWLGERLAAQLGLPHVEIDALYWQPDWTPLPDAELRARVAAVVAEASWIIDGNYGSKVQPMILEAADTVIWLDLPRRQVMTAVTRRTLDRVIRRRPLWNDNRERIRDLLRWKPEENIIRWAWVQHPRHRSRYTKLMADPTHADLTWIRLRSRAEVTDWLAAQPRTV